MRCMSDLRAAAPSFPLSQENSHLIRVVCGLTSKSLKVQLSLREKARSCEQTRKRGPWGGSGPGAPWPDPARRARALSGARLLCDPRTVAHQPPLTAGCSRRGYWSGSPLPSPGGLPAWNLHPLRLLHWQVDSLQVAPPGKPTHVRAAR